MVPDHRRRAPRSRGPRARPPTRRRGGGGRALRRDGSLSTSWSSAAVSTSRRSTGCPCLVVRAAPARPRRRATRAACRTNLAGGSASAAGGRPPGDRGWSWARSYPMGAAQSPVAGIGGRTRRDVAQRGPRRSRRRAASRPGSGSRTGTRTRRRRSAACADGRRGRGGRAPRAAAAPLAAGRSSVTVRPASAARRRPTRPGRSGGSRAPPPAAAPSVARAGWPYVLPAPAEATATRGRTASTNAWVVAVRLPWWATLRRSTRGRPRASSAGSIALLDVAGEQEPPPVRLAEEHDRDVVDPRSPCPAAPAGPCPDRATAPASRPRRAAAARRSRGRRAAARRGARRPRPPSPGRVRACRARTRARRAYRSRIRARPATWSSCGWVSTTTSSRRSHGGIRSSSATRTRFGIGAAVDEHPGAGPGLERGSRRPARRRGR